MSGKRERRESDNLALDGGKSPADGPRKKRTNADINEDDNNMPNVNQQLLEALRAQNGLLKSIDKGLKSIEAELKSIDKGVKSMDARLGRLERQDQGGNPLQRRLKHAPPGPPPVQHDGSWKFVDIALTTFNARQSMMSTGSAEPAYIPAFGQVEKDGLELKEIAVSSLKLSHQSWPKSGFVGGLQLAPYWSDDYARRNSELPQLQFNGKTKLELKSGIYSLTIKYNKPQVQYGFEQYAAIIIGEMEFNNKGFVLAEGADWERLLTDQKQIQLPYSHNTRGVPHWSNHKISEPWEDGDELKFRVDTNENTMVFQRGNMPKKTFWNVLAFTNNRIYPEFLHMYALCGWWLTASGIVNYEALNHSLTIIP